MRALIVAATVALSVTAAQAQQGSTDRAVPPAAVMPTSTLIEQLKAAGELKGTRTLEAPAPKIDTTEAKPVEAKPVEAKPVEAASVDAKPAEAKPADPQPVMDKPVEAKPVETAKPAETKAVESKPVDSKPAQAAEAKPVKPRVVRKRETDEEKARRIAAKYGVTW